jgi:hypothetical protein
MSDYRYLCPKCGRAFEQATPLSVCPDCQVQLRATVGAADGPASAGTVNLPPHLDIAAVMRQVVALRPPEETVDEALREVLQRECPQGSELLFRLLSEVLSVQQRMGRFTRLEAAAQVANGRSEMHLSPQGRPEITSFHFQPTGLDQLSPDQREQVMQQLAEAERAGEPIPRRIVLNPPPRTPRLNPIVLVVAVALGLAASYCLFHVLAGR